MDETDSRPDPTPDPGRGSWTSHVAMAVATGLVTTYLPVQRWNPAARWALHGGMAVGAGATSALVVRRPDLVRRRSEPHEPLGPLPTATVATGIAALVLGASLGGEAVDGWAERRLAARGVRRPRVWMGVVAAAASLAMSAADERRATQVALDAPSSPG